MKTLGLIGGTSWISTIDYYRYINQMVNEKLGGINSQKIFLYSLNMEDLFRLGSAGDWEGVGNYFTEIALKLQSCGAECLVLCANTPHIVADSIQQKIKIPLIHIAEATAKEITKHKISKVALLGTKLTMEMDFFKSRLAKYEIETLIPEPENKRDFIHATIFDELGKNILKDETKKKYIELISELQEKGAQGVILGCTEIPLLIKQEDCAIKTFDTTFIHAKAAVEFALS